MTDGEVWREIAATIARRFGAGTALHEAAWRGRKSYEARNMFRRLFGAMREDRRAALTAECPAVETLVRESE